MAALPALGSLPLGLLGAVALATACEHAATAPPDPRPGSGAMQAVSGPGKLTPHSRYNPRFDPDDFVKGVDNPFFSLPPGRRWIYVGEEDGEREFNVVLVTHRRKTVLGIEAVVVLDRVFVEGELKEKTFDWYAQDKQGNVWYLGEDSREFEEGEVASTEGSWEAGVDGARAGIIMPAHPRPGQHYHQEFLRGEAEDEARVTALDVEVSVPYGHFRHCIRTIEWTRLEPGITEAKFFCRGVGFVKGRGVKGVDSRLVLKQVFD